MSIDRQGDRGILAIWIGLLLLLNLFLVAALFFPLTPVVALCILLPVLIIALWEQQNRIFIRQLLLIRQTKLLLILLPLLAASITGIQVIHWYDSGLYHIQDIKWLATFGLVPGLALIHSRFGFVSSWFSCAKYQNLASSSGPAD